MRILHAVTLVSPDGAFGGPVRVAANLATELRNRGHDVRLAAAHQGYAGAVPTELDGTPLHSFQARRVLPTAAFSGVAAPGMLRWLPRAIKGADIVHVHLARDLVTLPVAELAARLGVPYVVQPHGQVVASDNRLAGPLDTMATRRLLRGAAAVLYLSPTERAGIEEVVEGANLSHLGNGVPAVDQVPPLPERPEVLFLSRVDERKRPVLFAEVARDLLAEGVDASFALVGPDEGEGAAVEAVVAEVGDPDLLRYEGALDPSRTLARLGQASLFVLPSTYEPYPMSVLEAMSVGRAVIVTDVCGLAPAVRESGSGLVVDTSREALTDAVRRLLADPTELAAMGARAAATARERFSMESITDRLEQIYATALARR